MSEAKSKATETDYSNAWEEYTYTIEYDSAALQLYKSGIKQPYSTNILRGAFDAGRSALVNIHKTKA